MNLVGYLITLANLQSFSQSGGSVRDISIQVAEIQTILRNLQAHPEFNLENFRQTGYCQVGNIGKYISKNIRNYIYDGIGYPTDEGVVLTLVFDDPSGGAPAASGPDYVKEGEDAYANYLNDERKKRSILDNMIVA